MEMIHEWEKGPEVIYVRGIDICDAKKEAEWTKPILKEPKETGTAYEKDNETPRKGNKGIFLEDIYSPEYSKCSPISRIFTSIVNSLGKQQFTPNSVFNKFHSMSGFNVLLSAYKHRDYYKPHRDLSELTMLLWLGEKNFKGGDLVFTDFDYKLPYEEGLITIFPSHYLHEVTEIDSDSDDFVRYCATGFIS